VNPVWIPPTSALLTAKVVIALAALALAAFELALARAGRDTERRRLRLGVWVALALAAVLAWTRLGPFAGYPQIHLWELFHHVIGAKYFPEVGYLRLYDCALVADVEAGFEIQPSLRSVRRLATNRIDPAETVLAEGDAACKSHFTPERWQAFAHDVAVLRKASSPRRWAIMLTDHGLNASPVWLVGGAALARAIPINPAGLLAFTRIDQALLVVMTIALVWGFGVRTAAIAWIVIGTLYLSDYSWIGGSFLRYDWLALSAIGVALVRRGWLGAGAYSLTWATAVRVFPGFLVAAVVLHAGLDLLRRRSLRLAAPHRRFALGCLVAIATLGPLSVAVAGTDAWPGFVANSRKHLSTPLVNFVGWKTVVSYDPATSVARLRDADLADPYAPWHAALHANFERRRALYAAGVVAFVALLAAALRRVPIESAPLLGIGLVVFAAELGSYYYALLALYAGLAERIPLVPILLLLMAAVSHGVASTIGGSADSVFAALSALAALSAVCVTALAARARSSAS
jgi:hypothetical protein